MAKNVRFFMVPEDEKAFFRFLERLALEVYPVRVPPDWVAFLASEQAFTGSLLPEDAMYFSSPSLGAVSVDKVKRGPDKGSWRIDEVRSPVVYYERSRPEQRDDDEEEPGATTLLPGKLWAEFEVTPETGRREVAPDGLRRLFGEIENHFKKVFRKSDPAGFWVGPHTARRLKEGLRLADPEKRGAEVGIYR